MEVSDTPSDTEILFVPGSDWLTVMVLLLSVTSPCRPRAGQEIIADDAMGPIRQILLEHIEHIPDP